jgi:hypothetical protein
MARRRNELQDLRVRKDGADNAFMTVIRPLLLNQKSNVLSSSLELLDSRMARMLELREQYHYSEANYESLELGLDEEEKELGRLETKFFSLLAAGQNHETHRPLPPGKHTNEAAPEVGTETPYYMMGISAAKSLEDTHPLYLQLSAAVGDLQNAREEYNDLLFLNSHYEQDQDVRASTGRAITAEAAKFFTELPGEKSRMQAAINQLEIEVQRRRRLCEEKGAMKKFLSTHMASILNPGVAGVAVEHLDLRDAHNILDKHETMAHPRYSGLVSQHNHLLDWSEPLTTHQALVAVAELSVDDPTRNQRQDIASNENEIETLVQNHSSRSTADFVNRWILQQLRQSPLHVLLLQSIFGSECGLKIRNHWRWQRDVLHYWWQDDTVMVDEEEDPSFVSAMTEYSVSGTPLSRESSDDEHHVEQEGNDGDTPKAENYLAALTI